MIEMIGIYNWFYLSINGVALGIEPINISFFDGCIYSGSMMGARVYIYICVYIIGLNGPCFTNSRIFGHGVSET